MSFAHKISAAASSSGKQGFEQVDIECSSLDESVETIECWYRKEDHIPGETRLEVAVVVQRREQALE